MIRRANCVTFALLIAVAVGGCSGEPQRATDAATTGASGASTDATATARGAKAAVASARLVLDVRTSDEYVAGHLPDALNIPVDEIDAQLDRIKGSVGGDLSAPVAVYCAAGGRAARAKAALEKAGFTHVTNAGGYRDLRE